MMKQLLAVLSLALLAAPLGAQAPAAAAGAAAPDGPLPTFQIADVHTSPHSGEPYMHGGQLFGDRYVLHQASVLDMIATAYGLDAANVQGGPPELARFRFEIVAKAAPKTPPATLKLMLRQLLADRFQLTTHMGMKPMPAWVMTVKDKSKLKEADSGETRNCKPDTPPTPDQTVIAISCTSMTMEQFAGLVHNVMGGSNLVVDSTGLTGVYDFHFRFTPAMLMGKAGADAVTVPQALDQIGLKIELLTAPRPVLIVDSVREQPTPNAANIEKLLPPAPPAEFEVATIKPSDPNEKQGNGGIHGDQINLHQITLKEMIEIAWDLHETMGENPAIGNAPKWLDEDKFDILAKVSADALANGGGNNLQVDIDELRRMLQVLLIERFQMKVHMEDKPLDAYRLVAVSPKLRTTADPTVRMVCNEGPGPDGKDPRTSNPVLNRLLTCTNITMAEICDELQEVANGYIYNAVEDATGLKGRYDFTLSFSSVNQTIPGTADAKNGETGEPNGAVTVFEAVNKQLGLKLEKVKRPLPVLVIDHVEEKPTAN